MNRILVLALVVVAVVIGIRIFAKPRRRGNQARSTKRERELYEKLLRKAFGDAEQVERLIELASVENPNGNRLVWMKSAIDRWERHNR
ncbi:MAG: hypothetical protein HY231_04905 [Acidobacteria bacterium]|nr:hypothetical protein [Acidobacteriota bacterium]